MMHFVGLVVVRVLVKDCQIGVIMGVRIVMEVLYLLNVVVVIFA